VVHCAVYSSARRPIVSADSASSGWGKILIGGRLLISVQNGEHKKNRGSYATGWPSALASRKPGYHPWKRAPGIPQAGALKNRGRCRRIAVAANWSGPSHHGWRKRGVFRVLPNARERDPKRHFLAISGHSAEAHRWRLFDFGHVAHVDRCAVFLGDDDGPYISGVRERRNPRTRYCSAPKLTYCPLT
jgi:hypothetical protein